MAQIIYALCTLTSLACAVLLVRGYLRNRYRVLFWSGLCFIGLTINNILLVVDRVAFPATIDLSTWRLITALFAPLVLLFGLIWERE
jgi:hypothetical protein